VLNFFTARSSPAARNPQKQDSFDYDLATFESRRRNRLSRARTPPAVSVAGTTRMVASQYACPCGHPLARGPATFSTRTGCCSSWKKIRVLSPSRPPAPARTPYCLRK